MKYNKFENIKLKIAFILIFGIPIYCFIDTYFSRLNKDKIKNSEDILILAKSMNSEINETAIFQKKLSHYVDKKIIGKNQHRISGSYVYIQDDQKKIKIQWYKNDNNELIIDKITIDYSNF